MASADMILPALTKGFFEWNNQSNTLEFVSTEAVSDSRDKKRRGRDGGHFGQFQNFSRVRDRLTPNKSQHGYANASATLSRAGGARNQRGSPKFGGQRYNTNTTVTLKDVKVVALDHLANEKEGENSISKSFRHLIEAPEFDDFLISLLHYFTCFFDQLEQVLKPQKSSFLQPSKAELRALGNTKQKLEVTKRRLGQSYCVIILGLGLENQHHMGCGKRRVSSTHRDKKMFEDLYLFCTYVIWVTFRRKEFERVKIEVGNMLRSKVFNPALQHKHMASIVEESREQGAETNTNKRDVGKSGHQAKAEKKGPKPIAERVQELLSAKLPIMERLTPAQHRRKNGKRPAILTSVHQRSTALVSLLPLPKEESGYLFSSGRQKEKPPTEEHKNAKKNVFDFSVHHIGTQSIGIIGEQTELFNMDTLMPKSMENEEDLDSAADANMHGGPSPMCSDSGMNRQADMISRVTTADEN